MKRSLILKILFLVVIITPCIVTSVQAEVNKQYIEVTLKSGEVLRFEYRSFIEMNLPLLPEKPDISRQQDVNKTFGENRVIFIEKDNCTEHSISLDNLEVIELIGPDFNTCGNKQKKIWLFKVYFLDLEKYVGYFKEGKFNTNKAVQEQGVKGKLLDKVDEGTLRFEDIEKITFFSR